MKHRLIYTLGFIVLAIVVFGTIPAAAQTTANGPYYATPSWDQKLQCDTKATCPRFIVLSNWNNEAVLDRETGLVWERSPNVSISAWEDSLVFCRLLTLGNRMGWRLPTIDEFMTLMDPSARYNFPTLPAGHPFTIDPYTSTYPYFWTATTYAGDSTNAWFVNLSNANFGEYNKNGAYHKWCCRGGQGVDPQ